MSDEEKNVTTEAGYSGDYVKSLRDEAASWRVKYRELEAQVANSSIQSELVSRGITAEAKWVDYNQGEESAKDAVDRFVSKYPQLVKQQEETTSPKPSLPKPLGPGGGKNTNDVQSQPTGSIYGKSLEEIKKNPKARENLRDLYRNLLRQSSNQREI